MESHPASKKPLVTALLIVVVVLLLGALAFFAYRLLARGRPSGQGEVTVRVDVVDELGKPVDKIDSLTLWIKGEGLEETGKAMDTSSREIRLKIPAGPRREFRAVAEVAGKSYMGSEVIDLESGVCAFVKIRIELTPEKVSEETSAETSVMLETSATEPAAVSTEAAPTTGATTTAPMGQAPTVALELAYGPEMAPGDVVFVRYRAKVTGTEPVRIDFNRDDSGGAWGGDIAQVNLRPGESFRLSVKATNRFGEAGDYVDLRYEDLVPFEEHTVTLVVAGPDTGSVGDTGVVTTAFVATGDTAMNTLAKGFISFDISSLSGANVRSAVLSARSGTTYGDRAVLGNLELRAANFGTLDATDFSRTGLFLGGFSPDERSVSYSGDQLVNGLQALLDAGIGRAQFILTYHDLRTDGDGAIDGIAFAPTNISLEVTYRVPRG